MSHFDYCPKCGSKSIKWFEERKLDCLDCGFTYFHSVVPAVAVLLLWQDKVLFTVRNQAPQKGLLDLPGGFVDPHETAEQCCVREIQEELNLSIDSTKLRYRGSRPNQYLYKEILYHTLDLFFEYSLKEPIDTQIEKQEISAIEWVSMDKIPFDKIVPP